MSKGISIHQRMDVGEAMHEILRLKPRDDFANIHDSHKQDFCKPIEPLDLIHLVEYFSSILPIITTYQSL